MDDFIPRNYQIQLMEIALQQNTIIYLPTGSGKTFIALMTLKQLSEPLAKSYSEGGKLSVILVNTVALVDQHAKYFENHTYFKVGRYSGEFNLDFWPREKWYEEYNKFNVIIMTSQILKNLIESNYIDLNKINLLIFDECHHGVSNQPMRQIMMNFQGLTSPPRVLGLTATLLNGNCSPLKAMNEVKTLETTYHAKVATVNGLEVIVGYSTNPKELIHYFDKHMCSSIEMEAITELQKVANVLCSIRLINKKPDKVMNLQRLDENETDMKKLKNLVEDCIKQIQMFGMYGGCIATISYIFQIERIKRTCIDADVMQLLNYVTSVLSYIKKIFENKMKDVEGKDKILKYSSNKVIVLISVFEEFKLNSKEELCGIVFVERRFTAKIVCHILEHLALFDSTFQVKANFMVGMQNNPYSNMKENLFIAKKNKQVIESFIHKEINVICSSSVLEEGVDIPKCTLVIKFDKPTNYRSYIQSKGRARHKLSMFYTLVEKEEGAKYLSTLKQFQDVENILNNYLIGKNMERPQPTQQDLMEMYNENPLPPYYVDGPNSANVNMLSAIALLCQYCQSLPTDGYTVYAPDWYIEKKEKTRVHIMMPTICPIVEPIAGHWMSNAKDAKRAAALRACILLHQCGELDDHLMPKKQEVTEEDVSFLFTHYPAVKEANAGTKNKRRLHKKQVPKCLQGELKSNSMKLYLHIINLSPEFSRKEDINQSTLYDMYSSNLCYGVLSPRALPVICDFPTYVSLGTVNVSVEINKGCVVLTKTDLDDIKEFQYLIFNDVLEVLKPFLIFDNSHESQLLLVVPVNKQYRTIDFDVLRNHFSLKPMYGSLTLDEKLNLDVTQENYLKKIVSPTYRSGTMYVVTEVSYNRNPTSDFPNCSYSNFMEYYKDKHNILVLNKNQPLLLVKALSKRLNLIKPRGEMSKKKRKYEEAVEYLIPELLIKQDIPGELWIQASFLPTILTRIVFLLNVEELRSRIALETRLGQVQVLECSPLKLDEHLLDYDPNIEKKENPVKITIQESTGLSENINFVSKVINKDYSAKRTEAEYPWSDIEEPKDLDRQLNVTIMDIEYYEQFMQKKTPDINSSSPKHVYPALTYNKDFTEVKLGCLQIPFYNQGPDQCDVYKALTAIKANDIVNLERLETLGDSFLKLIATLYITLKFPDFNEGQSTTLKSRIVSNKNLYYLAVKKNLGGIMQYSTLAPKEEWLPPSYCAPSKVQNEILDKNMSYSSLFDVNIPAEEQITGILSLDTVNEINNLETVKENPEELESCLHSVCHFLKHQYIGDKNVADAIEALIGLYFETSGFTGAVKIVEWIGIIPKSERLLDLIKQPSKSPLITSVTDISRFNFMLPEWVKIEKQLDYTFKNRAYLLQALTHGSYSCNRLTRSYETLEFLGDAVLDFLITCHIYESCGFLNPGQLTDLRSALVNNNTFASFVVRLGIQKSLLIMNSQLQGQIDRFVSYMQSRNYVIDDEVVILLDEDDLHLAEYVDVPKILGDIFEALAGAIYLDSNKDLNVVWRVFYKIMYKEIDMFSKNVPKNVIRKLYETQGLYPKFSDATPATGNTTMVALEYMLNGRPKRVFGFGTNKTMAKKAAAKIALRSLNL
ncbi:unnamed protein product [Brassicogethes aeneus]|uniref:Uncharacterized protein n=1 Tax=Brassicogethes aeneus TaxID=1431903 RepID=A0A9P0FFY5_BRAAE|nr:unnamed protein product [Brassicogethes aeneus]